MVHPNTEKNAHMYIRRLAWLNGELMTKLQYIKDTYWRSEWGQTAKGELRHITWASKDAVRKARAQLE